MYSQYKDLYRLVIGNTWEYIGNTWEYWEYIGNTWEYVGIHVFPGIWEYMGILYGKGLPTAFKLFIVLNNLSHPTH